MGFNAVEFSESLAGVVEGAGAGLLRVDARPGLASSGLVWADGTILTSSHAVDKEEQIEIGLPDGETSTADLVGRDPQTDLAVLKTAAKGLTAAKWNEGLEGVKVGHLAVALGRPGRTVRAALGIVGTFGPSWRTPAGGKIDRYLQADLRLPPGFSGGALVDLQGRVLGMATSGLLRRHSLAVPYATAKRVVDEVLAHGQVRRGFLGIGVYPVRLPDGLQKEAGQTFGALIHSVQPGSAADRAGLVQGDVLLTLDAQPVGNPGDLFGFLDGEKVGREVTARIARAGKAQDVKVTVGTRGQDA